ncbi:MAG: zinc metallopeptidase [Bacteroidota bacterium]
MELVVFIIFLISIGISQTFKSKLDRYSRMVLPTRFSGAEAASSMLQENGIKGIKILCTPGYLTDHYNPVTKTVNLSKDVYYGQTIGALAVAAHECGHALQHAKNYPMLHFRSAMVPALSATSQMMPWVIMLGIVLINTTSIPLQIGIGLFSFTTLFSFVTLPVEFDASRRALAWISHKSFLDRQEYDKARDALWWAAMTYVVAALASLAQLLRLLTILLGSKRRD